MKWLPAAGTVTPQAPANVQLYRLGRVPEPASPPRVSPIQVEAQTRQVLPADRVAPAVFCSSPAVTRSMSLPAVAPALRTRSPIRLRTNTSVPAQTPVAVSAWPPLVAALTPVRSAESRVGQECGRSC